MELFIEKAKQGLRIFIVCDMFGSAFLVNSPLVKQLQSHGGYIHFYNNLSVLHMFMPWRWFPRNHTKTLLIDSQIAYTGGVCMAERMRDWRDTHVRLTGPDIGQIREAFDDIENRITHTKPAKKQRGRRFHYFLNRPRQKKFHVYREFMKAISGAKEYIYITSAYFIPNYHFLRALKKAHARGVDIRVLVPERSDLVFADWIRLSYTPRFLRTGMRLFHYEATILHSKTAIIDDKWGTVGSTNFDVMSFFHNREANIVTADKNAIEELKQQFFEDIKQSSELTWESWKNIPWWKKLFGSMGRILRAFF